MRWALGLMVAAGTLAAGCERGSGGREAASATASTSQSVSSSEEKTGTLQGQVYAVGGIPTATDWPPPYRAACTVIVLDSGHNGVKEVPADGAGHFETTLAAGAYYLRVKETSPIAGTVEDGPFDVPAGGSVAASARYDDGRR